MARWSSTISKALAHSLPFDVSDTLVLQEMQNKTGTKGEWNKTGQVIEVLLYDSYLVKIHGSRGVTQWNCCFLKKM